VRVPAAAAAAVTDRPGTGIYTAIPRRRRITNNNDNDNTTADQDVTEPQPPPDVPPSAAALVTPILQQQRLLYPMVDAAPERGYDNDRANDAAIRTDDPHQLRRRGKPVAAGAAVVLSGEQ
jgi:hypothetical protein